MTGKISVVINTLNEERNIARAIKSVEFANEVLVCDMNSDDDTAVIAKRMGAKVIFHRRVGFVEPARNFAISKASNEWILILDADEEIPSSLASRLVSMTERQIVATFVEIPRKNIIFGKWMKAAMWWPDYNIRFFKTGSLNWSDKIHSKPKTEGQGIRLPEDDRWAIIHHNYSTLSQFIERMNRYTSIEAREIKNNGYQFEWTDLINKPLNEFLSRFFASKGFTDGLHGLSLSLLQALSFLVVYLKVWEMDDFKEKNIDFEDFNKLINKSGEDFKYWLRYGNLSKNPVKKFLQKARNKINS